MQAILMRRPHETRPFAQSSGTAGIASAQHCTAACPENRGRPALGQRPQGRSGVDNRLLNSHPYIANSTNEVNEALRDFFDPLAILVAILRHPRRVNAGAAIALALTTGGVALARASVPRPAPRSPFRFPKRGRFSRRRARSSIDSTGEQAQLINASMPFLNAPPSSRPALHPHRR